MAHRNDRWFAVLKNGGSFHGDVSHNQRVCRITTVTTVIFHGELLNNQRVCLITTVTTYNKLQWWMVHDWPNTKQCVYLGLLSVLHRCIRATARLSHCATSGMLSEAGWGWQRLAVAGDGKINSAAQQFKFPIRELTDGKIRNRHILYAYIITYIYISVCVCVTYVRKAGMLWGFVCLCFSGPTSIFRGDRETRSPDQFFWASTPSTNQHFSMVIPGLSPWIFWDNSLRFPQDHVGCVFPTVVFICARFWRCWRAWDQQARYRNSESVRATHGAPLPGLGGCYDGPNHPT